MLWFFIVLIVLLSLALLQGYFDKRAEKQRTEGMRQAARELGFDFTVQDRRDEPFVFYAMDAFHLFGKGESKQIYNALRGTVNDWPVAVFDYCYKTRHRRPSQTWRQTVLCFQVGQAELPSFFLRPETFLDRLGELFGGRDIEVKEHPVFSKKYLLRGRNERAIHELFTETVQAFFAGVPGVTVEADGQQLLYYRPNHLVEPTDLRAFLEEGLKALSVLRPAARRDS